MSSLIEIASQLLLLTESRTTHLQGHKSSLKNAEYQQEKQSSTLAK